jgi:hypothetical protein
VLLESLTAWVSPCLGTHFVLIDGKLAVYGPENRRLLTYEEIEAAWSQAEQRTIQERQRAGRLAAPLRALGVAPEGE